MMKFGREIFFTGGLYNSPGTFAGPARDLPDGFYEILFIIFRILLLIIFDIFRAKMKIYGRIFFLLNANTVDPGLSWELPGASLTFFMKYRSYNPNFNSNKF